MRAQAAGALTLTDTSTGQAIEVELALPVPTGPSARKRISIRPTAPVAEGTALHLHVAPTAVLDSFLNGLATAYDRDLTWSAVGSALLEDTAPPELALVRVFENVLTVAFTEAIDPAQAVSAIRVDGNPVAWVSEEGGYGVHTDPPLASGAHRIEIAASLTDLAGTPLGTAFSRTVEFTPLGALVYARPDPREITSSAASNPYGFQGLPKDLETGFVYMRNRYYDPELGRFVTPDPLGYVDGGNLYQYAGNDPVNDSDPLGLAQVSKAVTAAYDEAVGAALNPNNSAPERWLFGSLALLVAPAAGLEQSVNAIVDTPERMWRSSAGAVAETRAAFNASDDIQQAKHGAAAFGHASQLLLDATVVEGVAESALVRAAQRKALAGATPKPPSTGAPAAELAPGSAEGPVKIKISSSRYPEAARHAEDAVASGRPARGRIDRGGADGRRAESLRCVECKPGLDRDEFPPAVLDTGGRGASVRHISPRDNRGAGASMGRQMKRLPDGTEVEVVVEN